MTYNPLLDKSLNFSARIVKLYQYLVKEKKETAETEYWIKLLILSEYIDTPLGKSLLTDCIEIKKILISSLNTIKKNHRQ